MMGSARLRFFAQLPAATPLRPQKPSLKSLFHNTLLVTYSFQKSNAQNSPYSIENREFKGVGGRGYYLVNPREPQRGATADNLEGFIHEH